VSGERGATRGPALPVHGYELRNANDSFDTGRRGKQALLLLLLLVLALLVLGLLVFAGVSRDPRLSWWAGPRDEERGKAPMLWGGKGRGELCIYIAEEAAAG
jgi:hypothetical protein